MNFCELVKLPKTRESAAITGSSVYFNGNLCRKGHLSERRTSKSECVACHRLASKKYRENNSEDYLNYLKKWRLENPNYNKDYYASDLESQRRRVREYHEANKDLRHAAWKRWYEANKTRAYANASNRRSRKMNAEGAFCSEDILKILNSQGGRCAEVSCLCDLSESGFHVDHIIPLIKGGSNWPQNLQCLCPGCNLSKGSLTPEEWAKRKGRLL